MIRRRLGLLVVRAYPRATRRVRGVEMVDTLIERSEDSFGEFVRDCGSLVAAGLRERGYRGGRLALVGVALLVCASGAVVALGTGGSSPVAAARSARVPAAWVDANERALAVVFRHSASCGVAARQAGSPRLLQGPPPTDLRSLFAVLRRPAPAAERVSAARLRQLHVDARGIYARYARQGVRDGVSYAMIPATGVGGAGVPARCYTEQLAAFEHQLPVPQRPRALAWERSLINHSERPTDGIVLVSSGGGSGTSTSYLPIALLRDHSWSYTRSVGTNRLTETELLVPDTVTTITASYAAQAYPGRVPHAVELTRRVSDNLAILVFRGAWDPPSLTFRSASGSILAASTRR